MIEYAAVCAIDAAPPAPCIFRVDLKERTVTLRFGARATVTARLEPSGGATVTKPGPGVCQMPRDGLMVCEGPGFRYRATYDPGD